MPIRLRLALWYGALFAVILLAVALVSYAVHARGHYDDVDRTLVNSAGHTVAMASSAADPSVLLDESSGLGVSIQLYNAQGQRTAPASDPGDLPRVDPVAVLGQPAGPAYDVVAGLLPSLMPDMPVPPAGAFGLFETPAERWRVYILPLAHTGPTTGYVAALMPLGYLDTAIARYRLLLLGLGMSGMLAALAGSWLLARRALRPVADLTSTAEAITHARRAHERVPVPPQHDELGRLATTFNAMLDSLDEAHRAQERFVSDASHELRAPLTAIQGNIELLRRQPGMSEADRDEALGEIEREATRLGRLVADLLALAHADAGIAIVQRQVDLDVVVLDAFRTARPLAQRQELSLDPFEPIQVCGDADRLKQLVLILLDNAIKYTPVGGSVTLGLASADTNAIITVADSGVGIASADLPHVFERFYRADPARGRDPGGTGLGLPIAQWIVTQHGGAIDLHSIPDQGTTATIRLPLPGTHNQPLPPDLQAALNSPSISPQPPVPE